MTGRKEGKLGLGLNQLINVKCLELYGSVGCDAKEVMDQERQLTFRAGGVWEAAVKVQRFGDSS